MSGLHGQPTYGIDDLLTYLINRVSSCPQTPPPLEQCLDRVLDVANSSVVRSRFAQHTTLSGKESEREMSFVAACNTALIELRKKDFPGLRPPSTPGILFYGPGDETSAQYKNVEAVRTPDARCAPLHVAKTHRMRSTSSELKPRGAEIGDDEHRPTSTALCVDSMNTGRSSSTDEDEDGEIPRDSSVHISTYGIEMLSCCPRSTYTFRLVVRDNYVHIWAHDKQVAIQSFGLYIVDDLPRLLTLLLIFDRSGLLGWSMDPVLGPQCQTHHHGLTEEDVSLDAMTCVPLSRDAADIQAMLATEIFHPPIFGHCRLSGRCAQIHPTINDAEVKIVKTPWLEVIRVSEVEILRRAMAVVDDAVKGRVPRVLAFGKFPEFATRNVQKAPAIATEAGEHPTTSRILRAILLLHQRPITDLTGNDFLKAFFDCFHCHHALWKNGFRHCDPSLNNLMIDSRDEGVMIDWDLAAIHGEGSLHVLDRTGTMPFMPLEHLAQKAKCGKIKHFYCHAVEAFTWTLVVVCRRFNNGKQAQHPTDIDDWFSGNYEVVHRAKLAYQSQFLPVKGQPSYWAQFYVARSLVKSLRREYERRLAQAELHMSNELPPADDSVEGPHGAWWNAVKDVVKVSKDDKHLANVGQNRHLLVDLGNFLTYDMVARGVPVK